MRSQKRFLDSNDFLGKLCLNFLIAELYFYYNLFHNILELYLLFNYIPLLTLHKTVLYAFLNLFFCQDISQDDFGVKFFRLVYHLWFFEKITSCPSLVGSW